MLGAGFGGCEKQGGSGVWTADRENRLSEFHRDDHGLWLISPGQEDASAQQAHGRDHLGDVRPGFGYRQLISRGVHADDVNKRLACTTGRLVQSVS